jgi:hypothetical protein
MTHITYATAKLLKEFLGISCPCPLDDNDWYGRDVEGEAQYPSFQLHDLLSKPFFEAMEAKLGVKYNGELSMLGCRYFDGGLPAVESALVEMMEGK